MIMLVGKCGAKMWPGFWYGCWSMLIRKIEHDSGGYDLLTIAPLVLM